MTFVSGHTMRVLIVDDNAAIQEILSEILSVDGYETVSASTVEDAFDAAVSSRPDAVLLDSVVGENNGIELLDMMLEKGAPLSNVLVLTTGPDQVPKDRIEIAGTIQKPFKSTEVLDKLRELFSDQAPKEKPKRSIFKSLFGKKDDDEAHEDPGIELKFGRSYLFIEPEPNDAYRSAVFFREKKCDVLLITSGKLKAAIERVDDEGVNVIGLSSKEGPDYIEPEKIGTIMGTINEFAASKESPAVIIDDVDTMIEKNDLNSVITMICQILSNNSNMSLVVSARSDDMTEKDKELLASRMEIRIIEE